MRRLALFTVALFALATCGRRDVSLNDRACGSDACLPGYVCDTLSQTCVPCAGDCYAENTDDLVPADPMSACDGIDNGDGTLALEQDNDHDGYVECKPWVGSDAAIKGGGDCDDADPAVHPNAPELCDGIDNVCSGSLLADERDHDNDHYMGCKDWNDRTGAFPTVLGGNDCNDNENAINPGAIEVLDGRDNNCVHGIDECVGTCTCYDSTALLSCYTLDSVAGDSIIDGASGINGTISPSGTGQTADGRIGSAYDISTAWTARVPNDSRQDSNTFTLQAWTYIDDYPASGYAPVVDVQGEYAISVSAVGTAHCGVIYFHSGSGDTTESLDGGSVPKQTWTHIACASDGSVITLFVNGTKVDQKTPPNSDGSLDTSSINAVGIGVNAAAIVAVGTDYLSGRVDHAMLFTERRANYQICLAAGQPASACNVP